MLYFKVQLVRTTSTGAQLVAEAIHPVDAGEGVFVFDDYCTDDDIRLKGYTITPKFVERDRRQTESARLG